MTASVSIGTSRSASAARPPSKRFSITAPMPTSVAPDVLHQIDQRPDRLAAGQEVVDHQHMIARAQELGRDHQLGHDALGVRRRAGQSWCSGAW